MLANSWIENGSLVAPFDTAVRRKGIQFYLTCRQGEENRKPISDVRKFVHAEIAKMENSPTAKKMKVTVLL
jgi:hypothetical protein